MPDMVEQAPAPALADAAITDLYRAHWQGLVRLAWLLLHDDGEAEEVVQNAFIATHRHYGRLRDERQALPYLRRSVLNGARSALRHRGVAERYAASLAGRRLVAVSAEDEALAATVDPDLVRALASLPTRQREVLVLRYFADWSEADIASALGISTGSVKAHHSRGLTRLRQASHTRADHGGARS